jgi:hypothetical protein
MENFFFKTCNCEEKNIGKVADKRKKKRETGTEKNSINRRRGSRGW